LREDGGRWREGGRDENVKHGARWG